MSNSKILDNNVDDAWQPTEVKPIDVLEDVRGRGRTWEELAAQYGVTNPDPPWRITLDATCDMLAADSRVKPHEERDTQACAVPVLERRAEEDDLSETIYADVPFPERTLLALAHSMIRRGLFDEDELARRMKDVSRRLNSV